MNIENLKLNISKLVFAYLVENNYTNTAQSFINECIILQQNPNLIKDTMSNKSKDNLYNIVEDYLESKKYAIIQSCNNLCSNYVKLKDILSIMYENCSDTTVSRNVQNVDKLSVNSKPKRGRKRKIDSLKIESISTAQNFSFNPIQNLAPLADFMAYNINKNAPNFELTNFNNNVQMDPNWTIDIDRQHETSRSTTIYPTTGDLQDIFLESLESVYPSENSAGKPLKRNDSLKTPDKEQLESLISSHSFHAIDNQSNLNSDLNHLWDSICSENDERVEIVPDSVDRGSMESFKKAMEFQPLKSELNMSKKRPDISCVSAEEKQSFKKAMEIQPIKSDINIPKNQPDISSMSAEDKQKILQSVDLNKMVGILKNKR